MVTALPRAPISTPKARSIWRRFSSWVPKRGSIPSLLRVSWVMVGGTAGGRVAPSADRTKRRVDGRSRRALLDPASVAVEPRHVKLERARHGKRQALRPLDHLDRRLEQQLL